LSDLNWKKYGLIISSDYRKRVLMSIADCPKTPKQIAQETKLYISHVSKTLNELASHGIVVCLNPDLKRGRVYTLTDDGKELVEYFRGNKR
jgi:ArsR family transcriptional regulator, cadmium/lead-responsive transcriptional repressor